MTVAAALLLAACGGNDAGSRENAALPPTPAETGGIDKQPALKPPPIATPTPSLTAGTELPPADAEFRYTGRWAVDAGACTGAAWVWRERRLETPAGTVCDFETITAVPGGYDIAARCTAEGPPTEDRISLRFAESARAMMVEAKVMPPVGLVYCGT